MSILLIAALFVGVFPQAGLATTAQEALFGGSTPETGGTDSGADAEVDVDTTVSGEEEIGGQNGEEILFRK